MPLSEKLIRDASSALDAGGPGLNLDEAGVEAVEALRLAVEGNESEYANAIVGLGEDLSERFGRALSIAAPQPLHIINDKRPAVLGLGDVPENEIKEKF